MMICGSCGCGWTTRQCSRARRIRHGAAGHVGDLGDGHLPIKDLVVDMDPFWAKFRAVNPYLRLGAGARPGASSDLAKAHERDPEGGALHQLRRLRFGVQRDGIRSRLPRPAGAREGDAVRRRSARRGQGRPARGSQREERHLAVHAVLFLQRALPEGSRPARRDRQARRRVGQGRHRPRHGRKAREMVRHLGEDDGLAS